MELWRHIVGREGYYISTSGRVWSEHTKRLLTPTKNPRDGYRRI